MEVSDSLKDAKKAFDKMIVDEKEDEGILKKTLRELVQSNSQSLKNRFGKRNLVSRSSTSTSRAATLQKLKVVRTRLLLQRLQRPQPTRQARLRFHRLLRPQLLTRAMTTMLMPNLRSTVMLKKLPLQTI